MEFAARGWGRGKGCGGAAVAAGKAADEAAIYRDI